MPVYTDSRRLLLLVLLLVLVAPTVARFTRTTTIDGIKRATTACLVEFYRMGILSGQNVWDISNRFGLKRSFTVPVAFGND